MKFIKEHWGKILCAFVLIAALCWRFIPTPLYSFLDIPIHDIDNVLLNAVGFRWDENSREIPMPEVLKTEDQAQIKEIMDLFSGVTVTRDFRSLNPFRSGYSGNAHIMVIVSYIYDDHRQGNMFYVMSDGTIWYGNHSVAHLSDKSLCDRLLAYLDVNGTEGKVEYRYDDTTFDTVIDSSIPPISDK